MKNFRRIENFNFNNQINNDVRRCYNFFELIDFVFFKKFSKNEINYFVDFVEIDLKNVEKI